MSLRDNDLAGRRPDGSIDIRSTPLPLRIVVAPTQSADDHVVEGEIVFSVAAASTSADRRLIVDELLRDREFVTADEVSGAFAPDVRAALLDAVRAAPAESILEEKSRELTEKVRFAADRCAFGLGLVIIPPFRCALHSPSRIREAKHRDRLAEVERATEVFARFRALREANPDVPVATLLSRVDEASRGAMVDSLMRGAAPRELDALVVAGTKLLRVAMAQAECSLRVELSVDELGPLRSVQRAKIGSKSILALGARGGVALIDSSVDEGITLFHSAVQTERGFHSVVVDEKSDRLYAAHGELGIIEWVLSDRRELHRCPCEEAIDLVRLADGHMIVGEKRRVRLFRGGKLHELLSLPADLVALLNDGVHCFAALEDGRVIAFAADAPTRIVSSAEPGVHVTAACGWDSPIGFRIVRATSTSCGVESFSVDGDDPLRTRFAGSHVGCVMIAANGAHIAAVAADRGRVVLWDAAEPNAPAAEADVAQFAGHRAAGICLP